MVVYYKAVDQTDVIDHMTSDILGNFSPLVLRIKTNLCSVLFNTPSVIQLDGGGYQLRWTGERDFPALEICVNKSLRDMYELTHMSTRIVVRGF